MLLEVNIVDCVIASVQVNGINNQGMTENAGRTLSFNWHVDILENEGDGLIRVYYQANEKAPKEHRHRFKLGDGVLTLDLALGKHAVQFKRQSEADMIRERFSINRTSRQNPNDEYSDEWLPESLTSDGHKTLVVPLTDGVIEYVDIDHQGMPTAEGARLTKTGPTDEAIDWLMLHKGTLNFTVRDATWLVLCRLSTEDDNFYRTNTLITEVPNLYRLAPKLDAFLQEAELSSFDQVLELLQLE